MLGQREGLGQVMAQKPQKQTHSRLTTSSLKEERKSYNLQTNTNIGGYMKMPGESAWSQHSDSAASMFPLAPGWEEDYQDLSSFCQENQQNMSYAKEEGTKNFSCIVQDDELNTPEIRIQNFDYSAHENVSRDDTSPMSLFEGGMWDIPSPITSSTNGKIQDMITSNGVVEYSKPDKYLQNPKEVESDQLQSDIRVFSGEICIPIVDHEEEILITEDITNESVTNDMDNTKSILMYDKETDSVQFIQSVNNVNEVTMTNTDMEEDLSDIDMEANLIKIESLLDDGTVAISDLTTQDVNILKAIQDDNYANNITNSVSSDHDLRIENHEINALTISNLYQEPPRTNKQVNIEKQMFNERINLATQQKITESPRSGTELISVQNVEKFCRSKTDLSLNLSAVLGAEDLISTPVILESLLGEEVSFDKLLNFIQPDVQDMKTDDVQTASTVDFSEVSVAACNANHNGKAKNEINEKETLNVMVVQPVVIKKSSDGKLSVSKKKVPGKHIQIEGGKQTLSKKRFVKTEGKCNITLNVNNINQLTDDGDSEAEAVTSTKQGSLKRKISSKEINVRKRRGRPPQEQVASSSKSNITYSTRQRKSSYRSDIDDVDISPAKRSRQSSVESEGDKYRELRDKNNEASRKSRLSRKTREGEMKQTAENLQKENQTLRIKAEEMERLVKKLRQALLEAVTKNKK